MLLKGKAWKFGDHVDTDVIIPARRLTTFDPEVLKDHCMEGLDPGFADKVNPGDIMVAGQNFGCGSSREHAPISIKAAGVSCVIAKSFARIFFRNAFNIGLPVLVSQDAPGGVETGDELEMDLSSGAIRNITRGTEYMAEPVPGFMQELVEDGGLMEHVKKIMARGGLESSEAPADTESNKEEGAQQRGERMMALENEPGPEGKTAPWVEEEEEAPAPAAEEELEEEEDEQE